MQKEIMFVYSAEGVECPVRPLEIEGRLFQVVVLECPYDTRHHPLTRELLPKIIALKIDGYLREYPYGVLPVDATDQFATHITLCEVFPEEKALVPIMSMKSVAFDRCTIHHSEFPPRHLVEHLGQRAAPYLDAIAKIIQDAQANKEKVGYNGSYTVAPLLREEKGLARAIREMTTAFLVWHYTTHGIRHVLTGAVVRFKIDEYSRYLGFEPLRWNGQELPQLPCEMISEQPILMMHLRDFSPEAKEVASKLRAFWDRRIEVRDDVVVEAQRRKKAA